MIFSSKILIFPLSTIFVQDKSVVSQKKMLSSISPLGGRNYNPKDRVDDLTDHHNTALWSA